MQTTPKSLGYYFPEEWAKHKATWLSWPQNEATWPERLPKIYPAYCQFIKEISRGETVHINVADEAMQQIAETALLQQKADLKKINFHFFGSNDAWCRDHGPAFLINPNAKDKKVLVNWGYNAWGGKYPPFDLDDLMPAKVADYCKLPIYTPGIIMEGGSVDFNGKGTVLTTYNCLLNQNRNPHLRQQQIEEYLVNYYGVENILWLGDGIVGDDTDGHIDDITRFVNSDTVVTVVETYKKDENYLPLKENLNKLKTMRLENGKQLNIIELPMPKPVYQEGLRLPASYANFYIANAAVVVPVFGDKEDEKALEILSKCFPDRKVVGINALEIIWGLGSWHCLSQQEPEV